MVPGREEADDAFLTAIKGISEDVLSELFPDDEVTQRALSDKVLTAIGRSLRKRGLKIAYLNVMPGPAA